ncbi:hypothetical protein SPRG_01068 [Saprolegnia parasitica CBS 223.65]|uniref:Uncharacterized protein n=1 Tax=Saprolegnia parasitica (strain CBS 223.65) TaxID=695850 RepID=A0A067D0G1_SAPPC|nr:hypothetical protein SPRG_01068 [Saprolegnia parasitica CBS 223.65]KDO35005.1 hypothetical protein SPRG_01068 [Saprolegnia parasitica CBS 223.65]|eukprot:XP_012194658.1 hypothetical protein SPRG_01068 [Saprolegnia parasitica CBS 223.65]
MPGGSRDLEVEVGALLRRLVAFADEMAVPRDVMGVDDVVARLVTTVSLFDDAASTTQLQLYALLHAARVANASSHSHEVNEMRRLAASVHNSRGRHAHVHRQVAALLDPAPSLESPTRLEGVDEDELEERWDEHGRCSYLRRNVLGNKYAPRHDCGAFRRFPGNDADIYTLVRQRRKEKLLETEMRRLARLNKKPPQGNHGLSVGTASHYISVDDAM